MDPRIETHADILVEHSVKIEPGDNVIVAAPPPAEDLVVALFERIGDRGANPFWRGSSQRATRAYQRAIDEDAIGLHEHQLAAVEAADAFIGIRGSRNTRETGDVSPQTQSKIRAANQPIQEERLGKRWVATQFPAPGNAQDASMSLEAYEDFVWSAINRDWEAQRAFQDQLVALLEEAQTVRVVAGDTTDITMRIDGMIPVNDYAEYNLPGGEVFTAPVVDSVEGTVTFDKPLITQGREITDVRLQFEAGEVVAFSAGNNEDLLEAVLDTDAGARRLGELGIGTNRAIDRFTYNLLFDEKLGDTVHMAIGRAYDMNIGDDRERNDSAIHMDMILDMSEDAYIELDGEVIQRNGTFVFEDGF